MWCYVKGEGWEIVCRCLVDDMRARLNAHSRLRTRCTKGKCVHKPVGLTMTQRLFDGYAVGRSAAAETQEERLARLGGGGRGAPEGWANPGRSQRLSPKLVAPAANRGGRMLSTGLFAQGRRSRSGLAGSMGRDSHARVGSEREPSMRKRGATCTSRRLSGQVRRPRRRRSCTEGKLFRTTKKIVPEEPPPTRTRRSFPTQSCSRRR